MKRYTVLSMEQALSLPSATLRFAQLGWRVIRIEATPSGEGLPGDPNRYIGARVADDDRRALEVVLDGRNHALSPGDCLRYRLCGASEFRTAKRSAQYLLVVR